MEGKEVRFGIANSALYATVTTDASCGAVNAMHDSFTPLGGLVPLVNMQLGEVVFGGVGAGLYGMLVMVVLTVFIAGLMVGRTPEYLGKKIQAREVQMAMLYVLVFPAAILDDDRGLGARCPPGSRGSTTPARTGFRDPVCLHVDGREQRQRVRRPHRARPTTTTRCSASTRSFGRFAMMVPMLALAGSWPRRRSRRSRRARSRHGAAVRRAARRRDPDRRRAHVLSGARARPDRRAPLDDGREAVLDDSRRNARCSTRRSSAARSATRS